MNEQNINEVMPLFDPVYEQSFLQMDRMLSQAIFAREYSQETNKLADNILLEDQGNYNAWFLKKKYVLSQANNAELVLRQSKFVDLCLSQKVKGFQVWEQKRFLTEINSDWKKQLQNSERILLEKDQKNYHVWSFRVWLAEFAGIHSGELSFAQKMIKKDPFNNSAWSYLYFLLDHLVQQAEDVQSRRYLLETYVTFCIKSIKQHKSNKASWNFLRGLFPSIQLKNFSSRNSLNKCLVASYEQFPEIEQYCKEEWNEQSNLQDKAEAVLAIEREVLVTLVHIYTQKQGTIEFARKICQQLSVKQPLRVHYWRWVQTNL